MTVSVRVFGIVAKAAIQNLFVLLRNAPSIGSVLQPTLPASGPDDPSMTGVSLNACP